MINTIISAISNTLDTEFGYDVHLGQVEQGLEIPCFFINCLNPQISKFPGNRYYRGNQFCIQYVPKSIPNSHAALWECNEVAESLTWCMECIDVNGDLLRGTNMHHEIADGILNFFMNYNCFVCKEETHTVMDNITSEMEVKEGE